MTDIIYITCGVLSGLILYEIVHFALAAYRRWRWTRQKAKFKEAIVNDARLGVELSMQDRRKRLEQKLKEDSKLN